MVVLWVSECRVCFNMKKATRSAYHKQIQYIERNEDMICKDRFSKELLSKDMSQFWRSVTDMRRKSKRTSNIIDDFANNNDVSECFTRSYENIFYQVGFNCSDINELYNDVTVDISSNCICDSECHTHVISSINIHSAIKLLKSGITVQSDIYICTIYVNLFVLFTLLRKRNFCPLYLRFLMYSITLYEH